MKCRINVTPGSREIDPTGLCRETRAMRAHTYAHCATKASKPSGATLTPDNGDPGRRGPGSQPNRDEGWQSHNPIGVVTAGDFLASVDENRFADGNTVTAAGLGRFNDDGKIVEFVALVPIEGQAGSTDAASHIGRWERLIKAFNRGDLVTMAEGVAEEGTGEGIGGKTEMFKALQQGRDDGWLSHNTIGSASTGEFLTVIYENRFADGRTIIGAGMLRLDADGLFSEAVSREPGPAGTIIASG